MLDEEWSKWRILISLQSDFPADLTGKIALVFRGTCKSGIKVNNAGLLNAVGAIVYNNSPGNCKITWIDDNHFVLTVSSGGLLFADHRWQVRADCRYLTGGWTCIDRTYQRRREGGCQVVYSASNNHNVSDQANLMVFPY